MIFSGDPKIISTTQQETISLKYQTAGVTDKTFQLPFKTVEVSDLICKMRITQPVYYFGIKNALSAVWNSIDMAGKAYCSHSSQKLAHKHRKMGRLEIKLREGFLYVMLTWRKVVRTYLFT